jgi:hypothetical protein
VKKCACGTLLSRYNPVDECWSCQERQRQTVGVVHVLGDEKPVATGNPSGLCMCGCGKKTKVATRSRLSKNILIGVPVHYVLGHAGHDRRAGEMNGNVRLSESDVVEMRREYARGGTSFKKIAAKYGIADSTARDVIRGRLWAHVLDEAA